MNNEETINSVLTKNMNRSTISFVNNIINDIRLLQDTVRFDTSNSSECSLDGIVDMLAEIRGRISLELDEEERLYQEYKARQNNS
jgi:hypothetical protein